ncbi:hypothetical protein H4I96_08567 [Botrytis cinerea]
MLRRAGSGSTSMPYFQAQGSAIVPSTVTPASTRKLASSSSPPWRTAKRIVHPQPRVLFELHPVLDSALTFPI